MALGGKREGAGRKAGTPNKATAYIRELAGVHAEKAIQTLVELMQDENTPAATRVSAAKELIERGFGRSGTFIDLGPDVILSELEPNEAIKVITDKVSQGAVSTEDGQRLTALLEAKIKMVEMADIEERLKLLEEMKG